MDPAPFQEKDLDPGAEQFILDWATEPGRGPGRIRIRIRLEQAPPELDPAMLAARAIRHFFAYQAQVARGVFRQLMRDGCVSLAIGLVFISACVTASAFLAERAGASWFVRGLSEGLVVAGWVGMWRPIQIGLYDWWPLRRRIRVLDRLAHAEIEARWPCEEEPGGTLPAKETIQSVEEEA